MLHARNDAGGRRLTALAMELRSATQYERIAEVASFVGEDDSGSFGILPGHARMMTALSYGLARYRGSGGAWVYVAIPGGVLYLKDDRLLISTRRYFKDADYARISGALLNELLAEEKNLRATKDSLDRLEQEMFRRLRELARERS